MAVNVTVPQLGTKSGKIPDIIACSGIGSKSNGVTAGEAARQILEPKFMQKSISTVSGLSRLRRPGKRRPGESQRRHSVTRGEEAGRFAESRYVLDRRHLPRPVLHPGPRALTRARWQSGYAAACKAVYAGSIPTLASILSHATRESVT